jgi:hypothetical protein
MKGKVMGEVIDAFMRGVGGGGEEQYHLEGSPALAARPSDRNNLNMNVGMVTNWWFEMRVSEF